MSYPCVDTSVFAIDGSGNLGPLPIMQWRHVAKTLVSDTNGTVALTFGGTAPNTLLHDFTVSWANATGMSQTCYVILTRGGRSCIITERSRLYLDTQYAQTVAVSPTTPTTTLLSRHGIGGDSGIVSGSSPDFGVYEERMGPSSMLPGAVVTVPNGQTLLAHCQVYIRADNWEATAPVNPDGYAVEIEQSYRVGDSRMDIFALPVIP